MAKVYSILLAELINVETIDMDTRGIFQGKSGLSDVRSLQDVLYSCQKYAEMTAFSCEGERLSYRDLGDFSVQFAALGIIKAGMVIVNINPYTAAETERQLKDSEARALIIVDVN
jgi:hypothetical protein